MTPKIIWWNPPTIQGTDPSLAVHTYSIRLICNRSLICTLLTLSQSFNYACFSILSSCITRICNHITSNWGYMCMLGKLLKLTFKLRWQWTESFMCCCFITYAYCLTWPRHGNVCLSLLGSSDHQLASASPLDLFHEHRQPVLCTLIMSLVAASLVVRSCMPLKLYFSRTLIDK